MMDSGIIINSDCIYKYNAMQENHTGFLLLSLKLNDMREVVFDEDTSIPKVGNEVLDESKTDTFNTFVAEKLKPTDSSRFLFADLAYTTLRGEKKQKVIFITYSDDNHGLKSKMLANSTTKELKKRLRNFAKHVFITEASDLRLDDFINLVSDNRSN